MKEDFELKVNEDGEYTMLVNNKKELLKDLRCEYCEDNFTDDDLIYYCEERGFFFHRDCLMKSKHHRLLLDSNGEHTDFPIIIQSKREVEQNGSN